MRITGWLFLLTVDTLIRKKVHRVSSDQRKKFTNFSAALREVLTNHKQLWNDARSSAELDKFKQALQTSAPATPISKKRERSASRSPPKSSPKAKKNKARRARQKLHLQKARATLAASAGGTNMQAPRSPRETSVFQPRSGSRSLPSSTLAQGAARSTIALWDAGFGDQCKQKHACVECGQRDSSQSGGCR